MADSFGADEFHDEWMQLIEQFADPDSSRDWFGPHFKPLLRAAFALPALRRLFPYQSMNELAFSRTRDFPSTDVLPAVSVSSGGRYSVMTCAGTDGTVVAETTDPAEAVDRVAGLIDRL